MRFLLLMAVFSVVLLPASSQDKKPDDTKKPEAKKLPRIAINDPAKLNDDADFLFQGEYVGELELKGLKNKCGMQVWANGNAKIALRPFNGGLPGDGWDGTFIKDSETGPINDGKLVVTNNNEEFVWVFDAKVKSLKLPVQLNSIVFKKTDRKSPTLDAKPPEGAIVLFNGPDDVSKWDSKAKIVELSDGKFLNVGGRTKQKFQSFTLHVEFRLPFMPNSTGQGRANSGVYLQDRYELQVLDSFGLKGENNECGGFYQQAAPKVNMCYPPMVWQTYDIDFTAAQFADGKKTKNAVVTVKHNGVVIHDKFEFKKETPGGGITKEVPEGGSIYLQDHGDPVVYRNIWIVPR